MQRVARGRTPYQLQVDRSLLDSVCHVDERVDTLVARIDAREQADTRMHALFEQRCTAAEQLGDDLLQAAEALRERISAVAERVGDPHELPRVEDVLAASRARPYIAKPFEVWEQPVVGEVMGFSRNEPAAPLAARYKRFEDRFRGPEARVAAMQRPYLALLDGREPVLDIGCGRGEMLDLLRERGIAYHGVDIDPAMIACCAAKGHTEAEAAAANAHLACVPDGHYGAIFSAQVIEHLPYAELGELLRLAASKLRAGGLLIAETVNPHAPHALRMFWTDLTHQHPIFPEVALVLCEVAGFESAYVFHPMGTGSAAVDPWSQSAYALVATAPRTPPDTA